MSKKIATLYASIEADTTKLQKGLAQSKTALAGTKKSLGETIQSVTGFNVASIAASVSIVALASAMKKSIIAASDMSETVNKAKVVFGDAADEVMKFGENAAQSMGMSKNAALGAAATFGNLFVSMGLAEDKSAEMSTSLVKLAGDLASFNNIDPGIALEKLRAGISGEAEPLRQLGVNLTEAGVQAKALEMGLAGTVKELTVADKAQARYALILEQTATAQGDFARTSDGLANRQRILEAQLADTSAELGKNMLPTYLKLVKFTNQAAEAVNLLLTRTQKLQDFLDEHNTEVLKTAGSYEEYKTEMDRANQAVLEGRDFLTRLATSFSFTQEQGEKYIASVRIMSQAEWENVDAKYADVGATNAQRDALIGAIPTIDDAAGSSRGLGSAIEEAGKAGWQAAQDIAATADEMRRGIVDAVQGIKDAQADWVEQTGGDVVGALKDAGVEGEDYRTAIDLIDQEYGTTYGMQEDFKNQVADLALKYKEGKLRGDDFKTALGELRDKFMPLNEQVQAANDQLWFLQQKWKWFQQNSQLDLSININQRGSMPSNSGGAPTGPEDDGAPVVYDTGGEVVTGGKRAAGGPVIPGLTYWVGENGPELFNPRTAGNIIPNDKAGAGGINIQMLNVTLPGVTNTQQFLREIGDLANKRRLSGAGIRV